MKQLEVTILGQSYLLGCPEGGEPALLEAVGTVDREMSVIRDAGKVKARERIAVLAALNLAYSLADRQLQQSQQTLAGAPVDPAPGAMVATGAVDIDALIARVDQALASDEQRL